MALLAEAFDHHMRAIGIITVRWSSVDRTLYDILQNRLSLTVEAHHLRQLNAGRQRLEYFRSNLKLSHLSLEEERNLKSAVDCLISLYEDRNSIAHGQYGIIVMDDGTLHVSYSDIRLHRKDGFSNDRFDAAPVTIDHLMEHANAVSEAAEPLGAFLYRREARKGVTELRDGPGVRGNA